MQFLQSAVGNTCVVEREHGTARVQDSHIVPLLSAGEPAGLLY